MIDGIRESMRFLEEGTLGNYFRGYTQGPKSNSDEDIMVSFMPTRNDLELLLTRPVLGFPAGLRNARLPR